MRKKRKTPRPFDRGVFENKPVRGGIGQAVGTEAIVFDTRATIA